MQSRLVLATMIGAVVVALTSCASTDAQRAVVRADGTTVPTAMQKGTSAHPKVDMPAMADHGPPIIPPALTK